MVVSSCQNQTTGKRVSVLYHLGSHSRHGRTWKRHKWHSPEGMPALGRPSLRFKASVSLVHVRASMIHDPSDDQPPSSHPAAPPRPPNVLLVQPVRRRQLPSLAACQPVSEPLNTELNNNSHAKTGPIYTLGGQHTRPSHRPPFATLHQHVVGKCRGAPRGWWHRFVVDYKVPRAKPKL